MNLRQNPLGRRGGGFGGGMTPSKDRVRAALNASTVCACVSEGMAESDVFVRSFLCLFIEKTRSKYGLDLWATLGCARV